MLVAPVPQYREALVDIFQVTADTINVFAQTSAKFEVTQNTEVREKPAAFGDVDDAKFDNISGGQAVYPFT